MTRDPSSIPIHIVEATNEHPRLISAIGPSGDALRPITDASATALGRAVNFNPNHDQLGRFAAAGGAGAQPQETKLPSGPSASAMQNAVSSLAIDTTAEATKRANPFGIYLTHYGPGKKKGGWDPYHDRHSDMGIGNRGNKLNAFSLAISDDLRESAGLRPGDPVYINGSYIGNYDDRAPEDGRVDIYDPDNIAGAGWGGMVWGGKLSNKP